MIIRRATRRSNSPGPNSSSPRTANRDTYADAFCSRARQPKFCLVLQCLIPPGHMILVIIWRVVYNVVAVVV